MTMDLQSAMAGVVVAACLVASVWTLMPSALRRRLAVMLLGWPVLRRLPAVRRAARAPVGCGCDGCPGAKTSATPTDTPAQEIRVVLRRRDG